MSQFSNLIPAPKKKTPPPRSLAPDTTLAFPPVILNPFKVAEVSTPPVEATTWNASKELNPPDLSRSPDNMVRFVVQFLWLMEVS